MTRMLTLDPGKNTGATLGYFDAITPYQLLRRWQIHDGLDGFVEWWRAEHRSMGSLAWRPGEDQYELVCEKFILDPKNQFAADLTPKEIEGALAVLNGETFDTPIMWQPRTDKSALTGYPEWAKTKAQRQRVRFDFLDKFGLFKPGTENDDSNDCCTHSLVNLKRRLHEPTLHAFWPERNRLRLIKKDQPSSAVGF